MNDEKNNQGLSAEDLSGLDMTPDWARKEPGRIEVKKSGKPFRGDRRDDRGNSVGRRGRSRTGAGKPDRGARRSRGRSEQEGGRPRASGETRRPRSAAPIPLKISFLPERHGLGIVVRRIRSAKVAFALPAIADLFLGKPEYYMLKVEAEDGADIRLYQCSVCEQLFRDMDAAVDHLFDDHAAEFFQVETVAADPPSGNFPRIARCGVSGEVLGPPNHHTYRERIRELHALHCPKMALEDYERRIETVEDQQAVEEWKVSQSSKTLYRPIACDDAEALGRQEARALLEKDLAKDRIKSNNRFVIPGSIAWKCSDQDLLRTYRSAWEREKRFPITLIHALRPALKHMHLAVFRMGGRETFVSSVEPAPIKPEDSISPIKEALEYIAVHPKCKRDELAQAVAGDVREDESQVDKIIKSIHWLVDCGHLIEFSDGSLALPDAGKRR